MVDPISRRKWLHRGLFVLLAFLSFFFALLPLNTVPRSWAAPDIMAAFAVCWVLRRPDYIPAPLVAAVFLMADMLFQRPPGLWAAMMVIATEFLRAQSHTMRDTPFPLEWLMVSMTVVAATIGYQLGLAVMLVERPQLGLTVSQMLLTLLIYPVVVAISHYLFGIRKLVPGEVDALGHRL